MLQIHIIWSESINQWTFIIWFSSVKLINNLKEKKVYLIRTRESVIYKMNFATISRFHYQETNIFDDVWMKKLIHFRVCLISRFCSHQYRFRKSLKWFHILCLFCLYYDTKNLYKYLQKIHTDSKSKELCNFEHFHTHTHKFLEQLSNF